MTNRYPIEARIPRLEQLTTGPMTETLHGIRRRLSLLNWDDLLLLCRYFQCDISRLEDKFWWSVRPDLHRPKGDQKSTIKNHTSEAIDGTS